MGDNVIKCKFNLFQEGRSYTGHHRNYILESARKVCYDPATREGLSLREKLGYLGHGRRILAGKLQLGEVETVKLPDGTSMVVENIPSNVTTFFEINENGDVEHHQELLLENAPGRVVAGLNKNQVGGFSWACGGADGRAAGATRMNSFHGFDYVLNPGFSANRGYILEDADAPTRDIILESLCEIGGLKENEAERYLNDWVRSVQFQVAELDDRIHQAAIFEAALAEQISGKDDEIAGLHGKVEAAEAAVKDRSKLITECAEKSVIVIPADVQEAIITMASEDDFNTLMSFFESAARMDVNNLPLKGVKHKREAVPGINQQPEYGSAAAGWDLDGNRFRFE